MVVQRAGRSSMTMADREPCSERIRTSPDLFLRRIGEVVTCARVRDGRTAWIVDQASGSSSRDDVTDA
ncbi:hypothetical protein ACFPFM_05640 [Saccharothrix xinjiangensis]|uniref:Uncharacterized protein n=1 Tax=Saccharothrix xinjiangensis TaxID=204798 RepID=A0ABV9XS72_9PSEU